MRIALEATLGLPARPFDGLYEKMLSTKEVGLSHRPFPRDIQPRLPWGLSSRRHLTALT
jgi:hypothetical protein